MKKILSLLAVTVISANLFAITFGVTADMGFNTMLSKVTTTTSIFGKESSETKSDSAETKFNGKVGAIVGFDLLDFIAVEPEFLFHFGNGYQTTDSNTDSKFVVSYNTIEIPVLAKLKFKLGPGKIALVAGPAFNFAIGDVKSVSTIANKTVEATMSIADAGLNSFIFSGVAGLEYQFRAGPVALALGGRYNIDLSPAAETNIDLVISNTVSSMRRSNFEFNAAAKLFL